MVLQDVGLPTLTQQICGDVVFYTDIELREKANIVIAFSQRLGGVSKPPYQSLNLGLNVGDDPRDVHENRRLFTEAIGLPKDSCGHLVSAVQVHGTHTHVVREGDTHLGTSPVPETDALVTGLSNVPLLLCFADCVPIILVGLGPAPVISVVHSGWRGTLDEIVAQAISTMVREYSISPITIRAYLGPCIGPENFEVSREICSLFTDKFDTLVPTVCSSEQTDDVCRIDLAGAVTQSLTESGVLPCNIVSIGMCSAAAVDYFFSYRAEGGTTGRHGALACIL